MRNRIFAAGVLVILLIAACSPASTAAPTANAPDAAETQALSPLEAVARAGSDRPVWLSTPLINAATGATFTLSDFPDKTVYVELMASWCTNCRIQQGNVRDARQRLSADNYIFISLSVEPNDTTPLIAQYAVTYNYPWTFAIVPRDMLLDLVNLFGQTVTNPTSTPHLVISPSGSVAQLSTGIHTTDQLVTELTAAAGA